MNLAGTGNHMIDSYFPDVLLYCEGCGAVISQEEYEDNDRLCDDCLMEKLEDEKFDNAEEPIQGETND